MAKETEYFVVMADVRYPHAASHRTGSISTRYVSGHTPEKALMYAVNGFYSPGHGLYAVCLYRCADDYHRLESPILQWWSEAAMIAGAVDEHGIKRGVIKGP